MWHAEYRYCILHTRIIYFYMCNWVWLVWQLGTFGLWQIQGPPCLHCYSDVPYSIPQWTHSNPNPNRNANSNPFFTCYILHPRLQVLHSNKAGLFPLPKRCLFVWRGTLLMGWACAALKVCSGGVAKRYSTQWRLHGKKWRPLWKWVHVV